MCIILEKADLACNSIKSSPDRTVMVWCGECVKEKGPRWVGI